jgi:hypothetical protein
VPDNDFPGLRESKDALKLKYAVYIYKKEGMLLETNILISCVSAVCGIVFGYIAMQARIRGETKQSGVETGQLKTDIEYIKRSSDTTLLELRCLNRTVNNHSDRLARVEESTKQAHLRINEIREEMVKEL